MADGPAIDTPARRAAPLDAGAARVSESEGGHLLPEFRAGDAARWVPAVGLADLAEDSAVHADLGGLPVCPARGGGAVHALLDVCSHGQVALSDGEVEDGVLECRLHGSRFELTTGRPTGRPATAPGPLYPVRVTGGVIEVALPTPTSPVRTSPVPTSRGLR